MMLKRKLTAEAWAKLLPTDQGHYAANDDGDGYVLQLDGRERDDDLGELRRAAVRLKKERDEAREERDAHATKLSVSKDKDKAQARKDQDIATLEQGWLDEKEKLKEDHTAETLALRSYIKTTTIDAAVTGITGRNTSKPENARMLDPHVRGRLDVVFDERTGAPLLVVLDEDGKATDTDIESFEKSVVDNKDFAAIIVESRGSGGGAPGSVTPGRNGGAFPTDHGGVVQKQLNLAEIDDPAQLKAALAARRA